MAALGILAGSIFKLVPALFLILLLLPTRDQRPSWGIVLATLVCFLVLVFGAPLVLLPWSPQVFQGFTFEGPWGVANPSALSLINSLVVHLRGSPLSWASNVMLWLCYAILLLLISVFPLYRAWMSKEPALWVLTLTPLFVLINPRPMAYGYFLAVPAMFALVTEALKVWRTEMVALAVSAQAIAGTVVQYRDPWTTNLAFLVLLALWLTYSRWCTSLPVRAQLQVPARVGNVAL